MSNGINQFPIEKVMEILVFESKKWNSPVDTLVDLQKNIKMVLEQLL